MIRSAHPTILRVRAGYLFAALLFISFSMLVPPAQGDSGKYIVYIGTYTGAASKGIYAYRFDATTGEAKPLGLVAESENPSFLAAHPNRKFLYAVNEIDDFEGEKTG